MKVGKKISPYRDVIGYDLVHKYGWTYLPFQGRCVRGEILEWLGENTKVDTEIRWLDTIAIYFRNEIDAMAFKLRWT